MKCDLIPISYPLQVYEPPAASLAIMGQAATSYQPSAGLEEEQEIAFPMELQQPRKLQAIIDEIQMRATSIPYGLGYRAHEVGVEIKKAIQTRDTVQFVEPKPENTSLVKKFNSILTRLVTPLGDLIGWSQNDIQDPTNSSYPDDSYSEFYADTYTDNSTKTDTSDNINTNANNDDTDLTVSLETPTGETHLFSIEKEIARGGTSVLKLAVDQATGERVAMKIEHDYTQEQLKNPIRQTQYSHDYEKEATLLQTFSRLRGKGTIQNKEGNAPKRILAMEYIEGENLASHLLSLEEIITHTSDIKKLESLFNHLIKTAYMFCQEIHHYHQQAYIHRDIKPENMMYIPHGDDFTLKLIDFSGMIQENETDGNKNYGTSGYKAPEIAIHGHNKATDTYAVGQSLVKIADLLRLPQFIKLRFKHKTLTPVYENLLKTVEGLIQEDPTKRISVPDALTRLSESVPHAQALGVLKASF